MGRPWFLRQRGAPRLQRGREAGRQGQYIRAVLEAYACRWWWQGILLGVVVVVVWCGVCVLTQLLLTALAAHAPLADSIQLVVVKQGIIL